MTAGASRAELHDPSGETSTSAAGGETPAADVVPCGPHVAVAAAETSGEPVQRLSGGYRSEHELATSVLRAIAANDPAALAQLRVTRAEYLALLWPEFPQAKDPRHTLTPEFHWNLLDSSSHAGIRDILANYGGSDFELLAVRPGDGIVNHESFRVLRKVVLHVRRRSDGRTGDLRVLGSFIHRDGVFKVLSFPS